MLQRRGFLDFNHPQSARLQGAHHHPWPWDAAQRIQWMTFVKRVQPQELFFSSNIGPQPLKLRRAFLVFNDIVATSLGCLNPKEAISRAR